MNATTNYNLQHIVENMSMLCSFQLLLQKEEEGGIYWSELNFFVTKNFLDGRNETNDGNIERRHGKTLPKVINSNAPTTKRKPNT